jgi:uncharacterized membrane protein YoaK (UPF0700 family)
MVIAGVVAWAKTGDVGVAVTTIFTIGLQARTAKNRKQAAIATFFMTGLPFSL